ncbi:5-deoxy-glucuronate isomerase [Lederbergia sp. NSJ-179]|uniref:5-deoxy-glucuronate isomerase n=1 Tax=Lederbergia sp. NSJ-179 TaxID=2931402 RepID=UPI001FD61E6E|nr:5-deoxy-glucuronate isomerase [Lederbergia sp. NSJ-179]MCJ7842292.1 5-deoxy-glucuronate isomerase [Lederbergia sp. NSJ-179]
MFEKLGKLQKGYTSLTEIDGKHSDMRQDIGIYSMPEGERLTLYDSEKETAILPLEASVKIDWNDESVNVTRSDVFKEDPYCLHVPAGVNVRITAMAKSEVLIQKTNNDRSFGAKLYTPEDCQSEQAGEDAWDGTAVRTIRTIFDYQNAPYSNMVIGEVISHQGRWSSYPPHYHPQPEVYYYRFDQPQGFGCVMVEDDAYRVEHNSFITIPGGLDHPQATAPGYTMYFCWMIRHLEDNPWTERIMVDEHKWLLEK